METPAERIRNLRAELRRAWGIAGPAFVDDPSRVNVSRQVNVGGGTFADAYRRALDNAGPTRAAAAVSEPGGSPSQNFWGRIRNGLPEDTKEALIGTAANMSGLGALYTEYSLRRRYPEEYKRLKRMTGTGELPGMMRSTLEKLREKFNRGGTSGRKGNDDSKGTRSAVDAKGVMPVEDGRVVQDEDVWLTDNKLLPEGWALSYNGTAALNLKDGRTVRGNELTKMMYRTWGERNAPAQPKGISLKAWAKLQKIRDEIRRGPALTVTQALTRERWRLLDQARQATTGGTSRAMRYLLAAEKSGELGDWQRTALAQLGYGPNSHRMAYTAQGLDWLDYRKEIARRNREIEKRNAAEQATVRRDPKKGK